MYGSGVSLLPSELSDSFLVASPALGFFLFLCNSVERMVMVISSWSLRAFGEHIHGLHMAFFVLFCSVFLDIFLIIRYFELSVV